MFFCKFNNYQLINFNRVLLLYVKRPLFIYLHGVLTSFQINELNHKHLEICSLQLDQKINLDEIKFD